MARSESTCSHSHCRVEKGGIYGAFLLLNIVVCAQLKAMLVNCLINWLAQVLMGRLVKYNCRRVADT